MDRPENMLHDDSDAPIQDFDADTLRAEQELDLHHEESAFGVSDELFHRDDADDSADMFENILDNM